MPFTAGAVYGRYNGSTVGFAFNSSNLNNPNGAQALDILQVRAPGGSIIYQLTSAGVVNIGSAIVNPTGNFNSVLVKVAMENGPYASLPANPTSAQIWAAMTPLNYNGAQQDLLQISRDIEMNANEGIAGGGGVVLRLTYNGALATS